MARVNADPPDFIQSGSYSLSDVDGLASGLVSTAIGTMLFAMAVGIGIVASRRARERFSEMTGVDTGSGGGSITVH